MYLPQYKSEYSTSELFLSPAHIGSDAHLYWQRQPKA